MNFILGLSASLLGIFIALQLMTIIIIVSRLIKLPLWAPFALPIQRSMVEDALPVLDTARATLEQNGFLYKYTRRARSFIAIDGVPPSFCDVYYHPEFDLQAEVHLAAPPTQTRIFDIYLWNTFVDGSALLTVNNLKHSLIPYPRSVQVVDGNAADFPGHIATHMKTRESITAARTNPADALDIAKAMAEQLLPQMEREHQVYRQGNRDGNLIYGFHLWAAIKSAWRMRMAAMRLKKKKTGRRLPLQRNSIWLRLLQSDSLLLALCACFKGCARRAGFVERCSHCRRRLSLPSVRGGGGLSAPSSLQQSF